MLAKCCDKNETVRPGRMQGGFRTCSLFLMFCLFVNLISIEAAARSRASVQVLSPQPEEVLRGPDVLVWVEVEGIDVRPGCNSIHIMLDNEPFAVQYDVSRPYRLHDVQPGTHTLRVYAANAYHEIIEGTLCVVPFAVEYHDGENRPERGEPLLTYVLPQSEYRGIDCGDIIVNFAVSGAPLSRHGHRVQYYVDGRRYIAYRMESAHLRDLEPGYHHIRMELVDEKGRIVPGPFNVVERTILLSPEKKLEAPKEGEHPYLSSIQGPMTAGRQWVARSEAERALPARETAMSQRITVASAREAKQTRQEEQKAPRKAKEPAIEESLPEEHEATSTESLKSTTAEEQQQVTTKTAEEETRRVEQKRAAETTQPLRVRRMTLEQLSKTTQTQTTLKAVSVGTTHTEYVRKQEQAKQAQTSGTSPIASFGKQSSRTTPTPTRASSPSPTAASNSRQSSAPQAPALAPGAATIELRRDKNESTTTQSHKIERILGAPPQAVAAIAETEDQPDQTTAAISRVIGGAATVLVVETEKP